MTKNPKKLNIEFSNLNEAKEIAEELSQKYPDPEKVHLGILELLINAVEHGNLEVDYNLKTKLLEESSWEDEIIKRLNDPKYKYRKVKVTFIEHDSQIELIIEDEGKGFNWKKYIKQNNLAIATHQKHGRGIIISKMMCFDDLTYEGKGNIAKALIITTS